MNGARNGHARLVVRSMRTPVPTFAQSTPALVSVKVGALTNDDMTAVLYALHTGMFKKAGLDVQLEQGAKSGSAIAAAVAAGAFDVGKTAISGLFDAHLRGIPFTLVAPAAIYDSRQPYMGLLVAKASPIQFAAEVAGTVGLSSLGDIGQLGIQASLGAADVTPKTLQFVEIPMSAASAAVAQKRVDASEISYPQAQAALDTGDYRLISILNGIGKTFIFSTWFTTKDYSAKNPRVIRTFAQVTADAARYTNAHHAETEQMLADVTRVPIEVIKKMPRVTNGTSLYVAGIQPLIDAEAKYGFIKHAFPAQELIDPNVIGVK
jgi:NitT/TauT family transport system substrate-binding protein